MRLAKSTSIRRKHLLAVACASASVLFAPRLVAERGDGIRGEILEFGTYRQVGLRLEGIHSL